MVIPAFTTVLLAQHLNILYAVASTFAHFYLVLLSSIVIYRVSPIHPLSRYPGPLHLKVSKLSMARVAATGKQHVYITKLHEQYGDAVRIGQSELSLDFVPGCSSCYQAPTKCRTAIRP